MIERRVGRDLIAERLEGVSRSEQYVRAAQRPQPTAKIPPELLLDYEFTKVFKALEGNVLSSLTTIKSEFFLLRIAEHICRQRMIL